MARVLIHAGGLTATAKEVADIVTPKPTNTFTAIDHTGLLKSVKRQLLAVGYTVTNVNHCMARYGQRYFATMGVSPPVTSHVHNDYGMVIGVRNTHDNSYAAGLCIGSRVFVCDNLSFHGDCVTVARRHTRHINRDIDGMVAKAIGTVTLYRRGMDTRIEAYKSTPLTHKGAHDLICHGIMARAIPATRAVDVLDLWHGNAESTDAKGRNVEFPFTDYNLWTLHNAFTETYKKFPTFVNLSRSAALHGICDMVAGIGL